MPRVVGVSDVGFRLIFIFSSFPFYLRDCARGCTDGIFTVKMAIKKRREHGLETWIMFLDLVKAFDRVPREPLWKVSQTRWFDLKRHCMRR